jgi:hypothetical protein
MNLLARWLQEHSSNVVVTPDWHWLIAYEFAGSRLLLNTCFENDMDASTPQAQAAAAQFAGGLETPIVDLRFSLNSERVILFSIDGCKPSTTALCEELRNRFGPDILTGAGATKPVNVPAQVTSPYQHWQRRTLSPSLVAQDFDAWLESDVPTAVELKQVKKIDDWMPYVDDAPNFRSLLSSMGRTSNLVVVAAPQGHTVEADTTVRPFLLTYRRGERKAFKVPVDQASDLVAFLKEPFDLDGMEVLRRHEWKKWR